jgi:hypothetical protein
VWRWRPAFQPDFAARLDWCTTSDRKKANHNPIAALNGDTTKGILHLAAKPGETVKLSADGSQDPDDNSIEARWFVYPEAGTASSLVTLSAAKGLSTSFKAPKGDKRQSVHVILEVQDDGEPRLTTFRRAVIEIEGKDPKAIPEN